MAAAQKVSSATLQRTFAGRISTVKPSCWQATPFTTPFRTVGNRGGVYPQ